MYQCLVNCHPVFYAGDRRPTLFYLDTVKVKSTGDRERQDGTAAQPPTFLYINAYIFFSKNIT